MIQQPRFGFLHPASSARSACAGSSGCCETCVVCLQGVRAEVHLGLSPKTPVPVLLRQQPGARGQLKSAFSIMVSQGSYEPAFSCQALDARDAVDPLTQFDLCQSSFTLLQEAMLWCLDFCKAAGFLLAKALAEECMLSVPTACLTACQKALLRWLHERCICWHCLACKHADLGYN